LLGHGPASGAEPVDPHRVRSSRIRTLSANRIPSSLPAQTGFATGPAVTNDSEPPTRRMLVCLVATWGSPALVGRESSRLAVGVVLCGLTVLAVRSVLIVTAGSNAQEPL